MIKKFMIVPVILMLCVFLAGCSKFNDLESNKVVSPKNNAIPIKGAWKISNLIKYDKSSLPVFGNEDIFLFKDNYAIIKDKKFTNISYKIKTVDLEKYIFLNYRITNINLPVHYDTASIVSVCNNDRVIYEFIIIDANKIAVINEKVLYYLSRAKNVNEKQLNTNSKKQINSKKLYNDKNTKLKSGVLFGLRTAEGRYKTIWIEAIQNKVKQVTECNDILLPRFNGFWLVGASNINSYSNPHKYIFTNPIDPIGTSRSANMNMYNHLIVQKDTIITFIGNDYLVLDEGKYPKVLAIDNLSGPPTKISDLLGDMGKKIMLSSYKKSLSKSSNINSSLRKTLLNNKPDERSFMLKRKNAHWNLTGRIHYTDKGYSSQFFDYEITAAPPEKMVKYDDLKISWNEIKEKVPKAADAYISPNDDIAVIVTVDDMQLFKIENGRLTGSCTYKIPLSPKDSIIMSEWAKQDYVDMWAQYTSRFKRLN